MELQLWKKPKNARIIVGYPGFGLVGTIATSFLVEHLDCERIGTGYFHDMPATIALHDGKVNNPIDIFYSKRDNIILVHSIVAINTIEWKAAKMIGKLCKDLACKEVITIEGVAGQRQSQGKTYFHTTLTKRTQNLTKAGLEKMSEGVIMGLSSAILITKAAPLTCLFAETKVGMPDSKAAARMIEILDKYLGLEVDYKPLLKQATEFEQKIKGLLEKKQEVATVRDKHALNYIS